MQIMNKLYQGVKTAVIYGASPIGANVYKHLTENGIDVIAFIDNFKTDNFLDKPIIKPENLKKYKSDGYFVATQNLYLILLFIEDLKKYVNEESIYISLNMDLLLNIQINVDNYSYLFEENEFLNEYLKNFNRYFESYKYFINLNKIDKDSIYAKILTKSQEPNYIKILKSFKVHLKNQYSYPKINFNVEKGDIVLDCGANSSKNAYENCTYFASRCGRNGKVYAFEPMPQIYQELLEDIKNYPNIIPVNKGVCNENNIAYFKYTDIGGSRVKENGDTEVELINIDCFIKELKIPRVNFIKMDIEGQEINALRGAYKTIKKFKPKLAICVYHTPEHFYEIPIYIKSIVPEYKIWILNNELPIDGNIDGWIGTKVFCRVE